LTIDHRQLGVDLFNEVWRLIETREDDERMLHAAHASRYHWGEAPECKPENLARGEWQVSRVYTVLGTAGDTPVTAYIGCGGAKPGVFRMAPAGYHMAGDAPVAMGQPGDVPVMANFTGGPAPDMAVWRPSTGMWFVVTNPAGC